MSLIDVEDTIVAIASPTSPAPRGIVRLSGPGLVDILARLGVKHDAERACRFEASVDLGAPLGEVPVSVLLWPTDRSYTGQPSAELHTFGSLPLLTELVQAATRAGARAARPGEFTMRAFLAGRLDLTQAEAVLGVIEAEQRGSLDHALRQLAGNLSRPLEQARSTIVDLLADVEAGLDFVDEDIEFIDDETLMARLAEIASQIEQVSCTMQSRGGGTARPIVAVRGEPNAGKSCLINRLAGQQVAIVTDVAGTTRDAVTTEVDLFGRRVTLVDTAGIEEARSEVSRQSQIQAERAAAGANIRVWCVDGSRPDFEDASQKVQHHAQTRGRAGAIDLWVATKADLWSASLEDPQWIAASAKTGLGIDVLSQRIAAALAQQDEQEIGSVVGTAARCRQSLSRADQAVRTAIDLARQHQGHEFIATELRTVADCLGEVTGTVYTDDILDRVFSRFCIGK